MSNATLTTLDGVLKNYYDDFKLNELRYGQCPALAMIPKMTKFGGRNLPIPIIYNQPQGRSATFATAQSNANAAKTTDFVLTRVQDYGVTTIDNEALEASEGAEDAFFSAKITEIDGILNTLTESLCSSMYGTGSGSIGQVSAFSNSNKTITLVNIEDIVNFNIGQVISASSAESTGARTGTFTVTAVDYDAGTISAASDVTVSITSFAANDYMQVSGDFGKKITGYGGWIPSTAPSSGESFFSVDRSSSTRLSGVRVSSTLVPSGLPIAEKLQRAVARVARERGKPDTIFVSMAKYADLVADLGNRAMFDRVEADDASWGFDAVSIFTAGRKVNVFADPYAPASTAFILQQNTWKLYTLGEAPRFDNSDGLDRLRQASADGVEVRCKYYGNMGCVAPGYNGRVSI